MEAGYWLFDPTGQLPMVRAYPERCLRIRSSFHLLDGNRAKRFAGHEAYHGAQHTCPPGCQGIYAGRKSRQLS